MEKLKKEKKEKEEKKEAFKDKLATLNHLQRRLNLREYKIDDFLDLKKEDGLKRIDDYIDEAREKEREKEKNKNGGASLGQANTGSGIPLRYSAMRNNNLNGNGFPKQINDMNTKEEKKNLWDYHGRH